MDWSSNINLNNIFSQYNDIKNNANIKDEKKEIKKLFEKETRENEFNYEDLIQLSQRKESVDSDESDYSDEEKSFFNDMKSFLYEKIAQSINRDKDFTVDDMLEFEKAIRGNNDKTSSQQISDEDIEDVKEELEKLQNRMISNITAKFFLTTESKLFKDSAEDNKEHILAVNEALENITASSNNPFVNNTKFGSLLNKIDKKLSATISGNTEETTDPQDGEDDTVSDIGTPRETPPKTGYKWINHTNGVDYLYKDGKILEEGFYENQYIKNGRRGTGYASVEGGKLYYEGGYLKTGFSKETNLYFVNGKLFSGEDTTNGEEKIYTVENGRVLYIDELQGDTSYKRTIYNNKELGDGKVKNEVYRVEIRNNDRDRIISATVYKNGDSSNTDYVETYHYNGDDTYTVTRTYVNSLNEPEEILCDRYGNVFVDKGDCLFNDVLYVDGVRLSGEKIFNGKTYLNGTLKDGTYNEKPLGGKEGDLDNVLWVKGLRYTGLHEGKYHKDGVIKDQAYDEANNILYVKGLPANGIFTQYGINKGQPGYFENGKFIQKNQSLIAFAMNYQMKNVEFLGDNSFKVQLPYNGNLKTFTYTISKSSQNETILTQSVQYSNEVIFEDKFLLTSENTVQELKNSTLKLISANGDVKSVNLPVDNAKDVATIDHSVMFDDADGTIVKEVQVATAANDGMFVLMTFNKDMATGTFVEGKKQIVFTTINYWQKNKELFEEYEVTENNDKTEYTINPFKNDPWENSSLTFGHDEKGRINSIIFGNKTVSISEGGYATINYNDTISIWDKDGIVNSYEPDGDEAKSPYQFSGKLIEFAAKLNLNISNITAYDSEKNENGDIICNKLEWITIKGVTYNINETEDGNHITLDGPNGYKMEYTKVGDNWVQTLSVLPLSTEDIQIREFDENGKEKLFRIEDKAGVVKRELLYEDGKLISSTRNLDPEVKEYDSEGNCYTIKTIETIYDGHGKITSQFVTRYPEDSDNKIVSEYKGEFLFGEDNKYKNIILSEEVFEYQIINEQKTAIPKSSTTYQYNNNNQPTQSTTIKYINGVATEKEVATYNYRNNDIYVGKTVKVYTIENGVATFTYEKEVDVNGAYVISGIRYDRNGKRITGEAKYEQLEAANNVRIYDINEADGTILAQKTNGKLVKYTGFSYDGQFSYTETTILSTNSSQSEDDDVVQVIKVVDNEQISAQIHVPLEDGIGTYNVNVDGQKQNGQIDNTITTWEADNNAIKVYVADTLATGVSRERAFTWHATQNGKGYYTVEETVLLGTIEDAANKLTKVKIGAAINEDDGNITLQPYNNGEIPIYFGEYKVAEDGHAIGDKIEAYKIKLSNDEIPLIIGKDGKIKDIKNKTYVFNQNSYEITDESGFIKTIYYTNGEIKKTCTIKGKEIKLPDNSTATENKTNHTVTISTENGKYPAFNLVYNSETGELKSGTITNSNNSSITIDAGSVLEYYEDYIIVKKNSSTKIYDKNLTEVNTAGLSYDKYKQALEIVSAYKTLTGRNIDLSTATSIELTGSQLSVRNSDNLIVINLDSENKITSYKITEDKDSYLDVKTYNSSNVITNRQVTINNKVIKNVPGNATITESNSNIITIKDESLGYEATYSVNGENLTCKVYGKGIPANSTITNTSTGNVRVEVKNTPFELIIEINSKGESSFTVKKSGSSKNYNTEFESIFFKDNKIIAICKDVNSGKYGEFIITESGEEAKVYDDVTPQGLFNKIAKDDTNATTDEVEKIITKQSVIDAFNNSTEEGYTFLLLHFVIVNNEGKAVDVKPLFESIAGNDNIISKSEFDARFTGDKVTVSQLS